ncbi:N-acetylglucosamine-6-phosphate deacetylase [Hazenella coriacea]|uniref:N-acetylglucosamine-6-phosphate deacetylase n=1 Tax=Hazenella coriacea TaxID=1179467 RepID=A0A4V2UVA5_9BACL|nr:N-acetylglucosamine-6-phosphate deacetylase [Hazenella coriacea]TCS95047.1 N-acetylglucosamine 6-phosphate deacetylase [Hazenella coriacea]
MDLFLAGASIFHGETKLIPSGYLRVKNGKIAEIGSQEHVKPEAGEQQIILPKDGLILPGMIDVHVHGANGSDFMDGTVQSFTQIASTLPKEGVTSFLATTMTQKKEELDHVLYQLGKWICSNHLGQAHCLGIHLEGPFINQDRSGAQPKAFVRSPDIYLFMEWQQTASEQIRLVTLAPEEKGAIQLIKYLTQTGVVASIGHSDATFQQCQQAIAAGVTHITHLFNGMRGLHHREPGVVGAAFLHDDVMVEVIADGVHVHPEILRIALKQLTSSRLILITDAMRAKCLQAGIYDLGGQKVYVSDDEARLHDGTLAGSTCKMNEVAQRMSHLGCSVQEIVRMTSINPAKQLNLFKLKGSIEIGKDADLVVVDQDWKVKLTICQGVVTYADL